MGALFPHNRKGLDLTDIHAAPAESTLLIDYGVPFCNGNGAEGAGAFAQSAPYAGFNINL
jgi:hypothetical protein